MPSSSRNAVHHEPADDVDLNSDRPFHPSIEQSYALGADILSAILNPPPPAEPVACPPRLLQWFESPLGMAIATEDGTHIMTINSRDDVIAFNARIDALMHPGLQGRIAACC